MLPPPREAWQYLVGQRRVRRAPTVGYDTPDFVASGGSMRALAESLARSPVLYQAHFELPLEGDAP